MAATCAVVACARVLRTPTAGTRRLAREVVACTCGRFLMRLSLMHCREEGDEDWVKQIGGGDGSSGDGDGNCKDRVG
ncbi:hypothetical protein GW17_00054027 [Ensete ventricosum]|nr:hypothetical protein GW17_00054027 [Ensete ventricosum]